MSNSNRPENSGSSLRDSISELRSLRHTISMMRNDNDRKIHEVRCQLASSKYGPSPMFIHMQMRHSAPVASRLSQERSSLPLQTPRVSFQPVAQTQNTWPPEQIIPCGPITQKMQEILANRPRNCLPLVVPNSFGIYDVKSRWTTTRNDDFLSPILLLHERMLGPENGSSSQMVNSQSQSHRIGHPSLRLRVEKSPGESGLTMKVKVHLYEGAAEDAICLRISVRLGAGCAWLQGRDPVITDPKCYWIRPDKSLKAHAYIEIPGCSHEAFHPPALEVAVGCHENI